MAKYNGTFEELKGLMAGIAGSWSEDGAGKHTFRTTDGGVLNWWVTGTVQLQGSNKGKAKLEAALGEGESSNVTATNVKAGRKSQQIFIVH